MFKFLKELLDSAKEGIQEGIEEGKAELVAEENIEKQKELEKSAEEENIGNISYEERFGTSLGAPFRSIFFSDWLTLFDSKKEDLKKPVHLYTFGDYSYVEDKRKDLVELLDRDFDITDRAGCISMLKSYFDNANIETTGTVLELTSGSTLDLDMWNIEKEGVLALSVSVISHIITGSTDVGYLEKNEALEMVNKVNKFVKTKYNSWKDFGADFMTGEQNVGLNNKLGQKIISKHIKYLNEKAGSPWNNIQW